ncbi:hypothetical protein ACJ6WF_49375 [Streptomyces sp. MMS24-I2-30]|uniref:hypothetical protein n=1 Tax=Streptomyces sp. MMS24-I2-30 TaxID=3351564 RepID=UPI0038969BA8
MLSMTDPLVSVARPTRSTEHERDGRPHPQHTAARPGDAAALDRLARLIGAAA